MEDEIENALWGRNEAAAVESTGRGPSDGSIPAGVDARGGIKSRCSRRIPYGGSCTRYDQGCKRGLRCQGPFGEDQANCVRPNSGAARVTNSHVGHLSNGGRSTQSTWTGPRKGRGETCTRHDSCCRRGSQCTGDFGEG